MQYAGPVTNRPYFGFSNHQQNGHPNFQWRPGQNRPMYQNRNAYLRRNQQNFDNSEQHWCETCDRGFNTVEQLEIHKQQHQRCNIDGCQFVAHPKVITKHIQMQHSSGLYKRIAKLNNPEEIKKWIEERKKKYPTKENVEKKTAEMKEKIQRGEKMGLRPDRFQRNNAQGGGAKRKNNNIGNNHQNKHMRQNHYDKLRTKTPKKEVQPKKVNTVAPIDETRKLRPFTGILNIDMDINTSEETEQPICKFDIEDDDFETNNKIEKVETVSQPMVCGALSSLMSTYGSSDEENDDTVDITSKIKQNLETTEEKVEIKVEASKAERDEIKKHEEHGKSDDDSGPEEVKVIKAGDVTNMAVATGSNTTRNTVDSKFRKKDNVRDHKKLPFIKPKPKVPSTLLHKLLHREVLHERNVILQCVRYIIKNNYFDK